MLDPGNHVHDSQPDAADRLALAPLPKRKAFLAPHKGLDAFAAALTALANAASDFATYADIITVATAGGQFKVGPGLLENVTSAVDAGLTVGPGKCDGVPGAGDCSTSVNAIVATWTSHLKGYTMPDNKYMKCMVDAAKDHANAMKALADAYIDCMKTCRPKCGKVTGTKKAWKWLLTNPDYR